MKTLKRDIKFTKCWEGKTEYLDTFFPRIHLSLYDYQPKASNYRNVLTYLKKKKGNHKSKPNNTFTKTKKKTQA